MAITVSGAIAAATELASLLGLNSWQIQTGTYNGVAFHIVPSLLSRLNQELNPAAGIVDATKSLIGNTTQDTQNISLPYGTNIVSTNIVDRGSAKIVVHRLPNSPNVFETMGSNGNIFTIEAIVWGSAYSPAAKNLLNALNNPSAIKNTDRYTLVHPIWGTIPNVYYLNHTIVHNPKLWRCCVFQITFESSQPINFTNTNSAPSALAQIGGAISSILSIVNSLVNTWSTITALLEIYGAKKNSITVQQAFANSQAAILSTANVSLNVTKLLVNNLQPAGYNNVALNNTPTAPTNDIPSLYYFNSNMTPTDVNTILSFNNANIQSTIAILNQLNTNTIYDTIISLTNLQSQINGLSLALLNSFYGTTKQYVAPYNTNLFDVCFLNNLDYTSQANTIIQLNKSTLFSTNFIEQGTILILPIPVNSNTLGAA